MTKQNMYIVYICPAVRFGFKIIPNCIKIGGEIYILHPRKTVHCAKFYLTVFSLSSHLRACEHPGSSVETDLPPETQGDFDDRIDPAHKATRSLPVV